MRKASIVALGAAPGIALGYFVLVGYILNKVRPLAITRVPRHSGTAPNAGPSITGAPGQNPRPNARPLGFSSAAAGLLWFCNPRPRADPLDISNQGGKLPEFQA